jgi:saccharopine dehydrogenase (NAD+, L-lysine-forming)
MPTLGIRHETKSPWERRVAVTPPLAERLVAAGHDVFVERSDRRVFSEADYEAAGCTLVDSLPPCQVVFGVKEIPLDLLQRDAAHLFFAHVIKGQAPNMPMLQRVLDVGATLLDYERITDESGRRLVFFGRFAGLAGMIDTLWALGQRRLVEGASESPFAALRQSLAYASLSEALTAVRTLGEQIRTQGVPAELHPLIVGVSGNGNVARGVGEVLDCLPTREIRPDEVAALAANPAADDRVVYRVTFCEQHLVRPKGDHEFALQDYYDHPERYEGVFASYLPHLSLLLNCIYWTERYPRLVRKTDLPAMSRCKVIGDISCDVGGSIEATLLATEPGDPVFTYDAASDSARMGFEGESPVICAVDILPAELPRDASEAFSAALGPFLQAVAAADYSGALEASGLPGALQRSCVAWRGELTPDYEYLREHL